MAQTGTGEYRYELIRDFCKLPAGQSFGLVSRVAADAQDPIHVFQRKDPPVVVFDREGKYLGAWGSGEVTDPHGLKIVDDTVYTTDRSDSVAKSFALDAPADRAAAIARTLNFVGIATSAKYAQTAAERRHGVLTV